MRTGSLKHRLNLLTKVAGFFAAVFLLLPFSLCAQTWNWHTETVDKAGEFTSIASDNEGNLHLSYSDGESIKYAFRPVGAVSKWFVMPIEGGNTYTSLAVDSQGHPHICYTINVLKYAHWDGSDWKKQTIATDNAPIAYSCSLAVSPDGTPHIAWYREKNPDNTPYAHIKFAELQNGAWVIRTLDFDMQTGKWESMTVDPTGNPVLSFDAYVKGLLKYAHKEGNDWKITTVDFRGHTNDVYDVGMGNSLAIDKNGKPMISYEDGENIKFAHPEGEGWKVEVVDAFRSLGSWVGYRTSLAVDKDNHPHIAYDAGGLLKHAYWDGHRWHLEILARAGLVSYRFCSMTIDKNDTIYISYSDPEDGSLKVAVGEWKAAGAPVGSAKDEKP
jgi:hypothetical protein